MFFLRGKKKQQPKGFLRKNEICEVVNLFLKIYTYFFMNTNAFINTYHLAQLKVLLSIFEKQYKNLIFKTTLGQTGAAEPRWQKGWPSCL